MKETTPKNWDVYWKRRDRGSFKTFIPRLQQFFLRRFVDRDFLNFVIENSEKGSIAEIGSGTGLNSMEISKTRGDQVTLVDFSEEALRNAKNIAEKQSINVRTINRDIREKLPFSDEEFTLSWNVGTLEHFENPVKIVSEMRRISKCVICIVPMGHPLRYVYEKVRKLFGLGAEGYYILYRPSDLDRIFREAGFSKIKTRKFIYLFGFISFCGVVGLE